LDRQIRLSQKWVLTLFGWNRFHEKLRLQCKCWRKIQPLSICFRPDDVSVAFARSERAKHDLDLWYQHLRELWQYKQEHGHCCVPRGYKNQSLVNWVKRQRSKKRLPTSSLSRDQLNVLNQIGFEWEGKPNLRRVPPGGGSASTENPSSRVDDTHTEPEIRKRPAQLLNELSSAVGSGSAFTPSLADTTAASLPSAKKQRSRAPPTKANSSGDAFQSAKNSASLVRLEPLPREIAAAKEK
jgi:Helicase associated domain